MSMVGHTSLFQDRFCIYFSSVSPSSPSTNWFVTATFSDLESCLTCCRKVPNHGSGLAGIPINTPFVEIPLWVSILRGLPALSVPTRVGGRLLTRFTAFRTTAKRASGDEVCVVDLI